MDGAFLSAHSMDDQRNQTTVIFACPKCGLAHEVTQEHVPAKMSGGFDCADCGHPVHSWYGFFDYSNWKAGSQTRALTGPHHGKAKTPKRGSSFALTRFMLGGA